MTRSRLPAILLHAVLYLFGLWFYAYVLGFGRIPLNVFDWPLFTQHFTILKLALKQGVIPFHAYLFKEEVVGSLANAIQTKYFARVHLMIAPHLLVALRWLDVTAAIFFHVFVSYTVGYVGLLKLCRQNALDRLSFCLLYAVLCLGGFTVSKLLAGQLNDMGYFLLPWVLLYAQWLLGISATDTSTKHGTLNAVIKLSLVLVYATLEGSLHVLYIYLLILGFLFLLRSHRTRLVLAGVLLLLCIGGAIRFLPILTLAKGYLDPTVRDQVWAGYGTRWWSAIQCHPRSPTCWLTDLAFGLTALRPFSEDTCWSYWEFNAYIGLTGVILIVLGGGFLYVKRQELMTWIAPADPQGFKRSHRLLVISGMLCGLFVLGNVYGKVFGTLFLLLRLPHVNQVPTRMVVYPLFLFACYAVAGWQAVRRSEGKPKLLTVIQTALTVLTIVACVEHATYWNMGTVARELAVWEADTLDDPDAIDGPDLKAQVLNYPSKFTLEAGLLERPVSSAYRWIMGVSAGLSLSYVLALVGYAIFHGVGPSRLQLATAWGKRSRTRHGGVA